MTGKKRSLLLFGLPVLLALAFYATYPFSDVLSTKTFSTSVLSPKQKCNVEIAARAINGVVLKPGEEFSFNSVVGPRTESRGYRKAPAYLGAETLGSVGGGVCLVSSAVYQAALESGCKIEQRVAHLRTIKTVPAGLDATVWYGQSDLRFRNTWQFPVQITAETGSESVNVCIRGRQPAGYSPAKLERVVSRHTPKDLVVELLRREGDRDVVMSRDHYTVSN